MSQGIDFMNRFLLFYTLLGGTLVGMTACSQEHEDTLETTDNRTILVYMAAQNSLDWAAEDDLAEMREGMESVAAGNHLLVYYDAYEGLPSILHFYKDQAGHVCEEVIYEYAEQDASSVTVERMSDVFARAFEACPAESYGLVLWSHGDGWLPASSTRSFGMDGGLSMDIPDLEEAVASVATHLDFIYFDACFMQSVEVAYQLRDYATYLVGCPLETPSPGSPYDVVLSPLFAEGEADVVGMARTYFETYADLYNGGVGGSNSHWTSGVAISVVQTDALEALASETRNLYDQYAEQLAELVPDDLQSVQRFDYNRRYEGSYLHAYYDLGGFVQYLVSVDEYAVWKSYLDAAVVYAESTPTCYSAYYGGNIDIDAFSGFSTYVPFRTDTRYASWNAFYETLDWYQSVY